MPNFNEQPNSINKAEQLKKLLDQKLTAPAQAKKNTDRATPQHRPTKQAKPSQGFAKYTGSVGFNPRGLF